MKILDRLKAEGRWFKSYLAICRKVSRIKPNIALIGTPTHGNIGDQAILLSEFEFLNINFPEYNVIEVPMRMINRHVKPFKRPFKGMQLLIHGGGFLGTLWFEGEKMLRSVLLSFPNHKIVILPQTVYYGEKPWELNEIQKSVNIYGQHKNLVLCVREKYSYDFVRKNYKGTRVELIPDMVTYLKCNVSASKREGVLLCMRNDIEKVMTEDAVKYIQECVKEIYGNVIQSFTDTKMDYGIGKNNRQQNVFGKIEEFSAARLIITDRLHGMVLAAIAGTPCIALGNCNYKIEGVYQFIKQNQYIRFVKELENIREILSELKNMENCSYSNSNIIPQYKKLVSIIKE